MLDIRTGSPSTRKDSSTNDAIALLNAGECRAKRAQTSPRTAARISADARCSITVGYVNMLISRGSRTPKRPRGTKGEGKAHDTESI